MNDVARGQLSSTGESGLSNFHGTVRVAVFLNGRPSLASNGARDAAAEDEVAVGCIDDGVNVLFDEIACNDQDSRRRHSATSSTRSCNCSRVAPAMPLSPIAEIVSDAHATPHTSAS